MGTSLLPHGSPSLFPSSLCLLESTIENFMIKRERSSPESSGPNISTTGYTLGFSHRNTMTVAVVSLMASSFAFFVIYVYKYIIFYPGKKNKNKIEGLIGERTFDFGSIHYRSIVTNSCKIFHSNSIGRV